MILLALASFCLTSLAQPALAAYRNHAVGLASGGEALRRAPQLDLKLALMRPDEALISEQFAPDPWLQKPVTPTRRPGQIAASPVSAALQKAQSLNAQASDRLTQGDANGALQLWREAQLQYAAADYPRGVIGSQINQAQALQILGLYNRARTLMDDLQSQLQTQAEPDIKALGLQSLGSIFQATGYLKESQAALEESLALSTRHQLDRSATHISLGNTLRALKQPEAALAQYQLAEDSQDGLIRLEAQLNQLSLRVNQGQLNAARSLLPTIETQFHSIPPSRRAIYARVNWASSLMQLLEQQGPSASIPLFQAALPSPAPMGQTKTGIKPSKALGTASLTSPQGVANQLAIAVDQARQIQDTRAESYALGELGTLYEQSHQWNDATQLTRRALNLAQSSQAPDVAYRWQWQMGRITTAAAQGKPQGQQYDTALTSYREAVTTLRSIRGDLVATNPEIQFSFRESVEPVYRELMSLLIRPDASEAMLVEARNAIEELQLAELENFFRSACLEVSSQDIEQIDRTAAVFYPIILSDRLEVLVSIPGEPMGHHSIAISPTELGQTMDGWLQSLNPIASTRRQLKLSGQLYDWLVRPAEAALQRNGIQTLVFVPDGPLRNLPMAALHDGKQYLVENYQVALTPGLQLLEPKSLGKEQLQALSVGLSESRQGFAALPGVQQEIQQIQELLPSKVFLDQDFTQANLQRQLKDSSFPIVHLATHGQFSSDPEQTFLLTWDDQIKVRDIRNLLQSRRDSQTNPIELLVLSACQTAVGDKQAALGLAGMAVQSGARSTLATLWSVNDRSTAQLMAELYKDLAASQDISRGESLRQAQLALLKSDQYNHPFYWSTFVLVGNWL